MKKVTHKQIYREGVFGGVVNTTLCGRVNNVDSVKNDGMNISDQFTCKFCLKIAKEKYGLQLIKNSESLLVKMKVIND